MKLNEAEMLAKQLLYKHGLSYYKLKFDNAISRFGRCNVRKEVINLSKPLTLINSKEIVEDTILHEIAHALDYKIHGNIGHGITWKSICIEIGCTPKPFCGAETVSVKGKYLKTCPNCGPRGTAHRRRKSACGSCCDKYNDGKYSEEYLIKYSLNKKGYITEDNNNNVKDNKYSWVEHYLISKGGKGSGIRGHRTAAKPGKGKTGFETVDIMKLGKDLFEVVHELINEEKLLETMRAENKKGDKHDSYEFFDTYGFFLNPETTKKQEQKVKYLTNKGKAMNAEIKRREKYVHMSNEDVYKLSESQLKEAKTTVKAYYEAAKDNGAVFTVDEKEHKPQKLSDKLAHINEALADKDNLRRIDNAKRKPKK